ncbi:MAG: phage tail protein [Opitutales bacterium]|nr:phage tail protein [Opitutales bacterium]
MSEAYVGEIRMFGGNFAPVNWFFCNGALLPISGNETLFSLIGTTYGGDGMSSFGLPDFRGRIPVHQGQGPGLSNRYMGSRYGVENVTLTLENMPAHSHTLQASTDTATMSEPEGNVLATGEIVTDGQGNPGVGSVELYSTVSSKLANFEDVAVDSCGGGYAHPNCMPTLAINYIICSRGLYPPRS